MLTFKTNTKRAALVALCTILASCIGTPAHTPVGGSPIPQMVTIKAGGTPVTIAAPLNFCVDRATIDENPRGTFMFLSDCRVVNGAASRVPLSAILTASVSPTGLVGRENGTKAALTDLGTFLNSQVGLFTMGKSNVDGAVSILKAKQSDVALYLLVQDTAFRDAAGASNRYWRAFTEINGRLVALSVTGYARGDVNEERSLRIIRAFMQEILDANPSAG